MKTVEGKDIKLISVYLGFYPEGITFVETKNHYFKDNQIFEVKDYKQIGKFDFDKSIIKWNDCFWKPIELRTIFSYHKKSYRCEQINEEEITETKNFIEITSDSIYDIIIRYDENDPIIKEVNIDDIEYTLIEKINVHGYFYTYYNKKNDLIDKEII